MMGHMKCHGTLIEEMNKVSKGMLVLRATVSNAVLFPAHLAANFRDIRAYLSALLVQKCNKDPARWLG